MRHTQSLSRWVVLIGATMISVLAQTPAAFEVASVKLDKTAHEPRFLMEPSGRVSITGYSVRMLVALSHNIPFQSPAERIFGGPDWVRSETYDIEAIPGTGTFGPEITPQVRNEKIRLMLGRLLEDRFRLQIKQSTREMPIYTVLLAKSGLKLQPAQLSDNDCDSAEIRPPCHQLTGGQGRGLHSKAATVEDMAKFIEHWSDRPIVDRTGATTLFEVDTVGWTPLTPRLPSPDGTISAEDQVMSDPTRQTLFSIMNGLGLKLEPTNGPVNVYIIEHAERPTEN
ncbi:MAG TPA: TIGR03435 family protein [Bryobacteraceae bacterium]|nr:TIGR03435 family protein [Bryobacteraceae bacterium]